MLNANLRSIYQGLSLGSIPVKHVCRYLETFDSMFPQHQLTFVQQNGEAEMLIYPKLTKDEQEWWNEALERLGRTLDAER
jgi:hypothetical protein